MTTRITVTTGDGGLLDRNAQQQAAARQAALLKAQAEKAAALGEAQLRQDRTNAGLDPATGRPLPSAGSILRRVDQQPAAFRSPVSSGDLAIGWISTLDGVTTQIISGNGLHQSVITPTSSSAEPVDNSQDWITYTAEYISDWSAWFNWPYGLNYEGYWEKRRMISSVEFDYRFTSSAGVGGQLILPAPNAAVFSLYSFGGFTGTDYKLSATGSGNDDAAAWGAERGQIGDIFEIVYVQGGADEDPDALFAAGTRRRGAELVFNVIPTYDSRNVGPVVSSFVDKSVVVNDKKTKLIDTPSALSTRMRQIFGSISAPEDVESGLFIPGYSLAVQNQNIPGLTPPFDAKRITYAGVELTVSPWSMYYNEVVNFPFTAFPAPVITEERVSDVLSFSLIQNFGFAEILRYEEFPSASFGLESYGATPFIYKILDNTYTFNDYDIPDSLTELFALLSPMPSKFQVYSRQFLDPDTEEIIDYYTSDRTQIPFFTYKNIEENYRPGADWYDFYNIETGAPNIPGVPAQFSKTLAPLSSRIELMNPFNAGLIVSTTFGESAYCLQSLAALGFSSSDLRL